MCAALIFSGSPGCPQKAQPVKRQTVFELSGIKVFPVLRDLGELDEWSIIYVKHLKEAMAANYFLKIFGHEPERVDTRPSIKFGVTGISHAVPLADRVSVFTDGPDFA